MQRCADLEFDGLLICFFSMAFVVYYCLGCGAGLASSDWLIFIDQGMIGFFGFLLPSSPYLLTLNPWQ
jgi:hypothetical protein